MPTKNVIFLLIITGAVADCTSKPFTPILSTRDEKLNLCNLYWFRKNHFESLRAINQLKISL